MTYSTTDVLDIAWSVRKYNQEEIGIIISW